MTCIVKATVGCQRIYDNTSACDLHVISLVQNPGLTPECYSAQDGVKKTVGKSGKNDWDETRGSHSGGEKMYRSPRDEAKWTTGSRVILAR